MKKILHAALFIVLSELFGSVGALATSSSLSDWYPTLSKPWFNPPSWIFAPVWTVLFALMGISAFLIWSEGVQKKQVKKALGVFVAQFALNVLWSFLFFGLRSPMLAFVEIVTLLVFIVWTINLFNKISKTASYLLLPYLLWVSFASILNLSIAILN